MIHFRLILLTKKKKKGKMQEAQERAKESKTQLQERREKDFSCRK